LYNCFAELVLVLVLLHYTLGKSHMNHSMTTAINQLSLLDALQECSHPIHHTIIPLHVQQQKIALGLQA
jgi:hypothetical protein